MLRREMGVLSAPFCSSGTRASGRKDTRDPLPDRLASHFAEAELNSVNFTASFISLSVKVLSHPHPSLQTTVELELFLGFRDSAHIPVIVPAP